MSGVTFMFALWPPFGPTAIPISISSDYALALLLPARGCWCGGAAVPVERNSSGLLLIGQQAKLIHAGGANVIHDLDDRAELRPRVRLQEDALVGAVGQPVFDLLSQISER